MIHEARDLVMTHEWKAAASQERFYPVPKRRRRAFALSATLHYRTVPTPKWQQNTYRTPYGRPDSGRYPGQFPNGFLARLSEPLFGALAVDGSLLVHRVPPQGVPENHHCRASQIGEATERVPLSQQVETHNSAEHHGKGH